MCDANYLFSGTQNIKAWCEEAPGRGGREGLDVSAKDGGVMPHLVKQVKLLLGGKLTLVSCDREEVQI